MKDTEGGDMVTGRKSSSTLDYKLGQDIGRAESLRLRTNHWCKGMKAQPYKINLVVET